MLPSKAVNSTDRPFQTIAAEHGLDLLLRAATQLTEDPKLSIVAFAAGVEIVLKARLVREHWSLIVEHIDQTSFQDFQLGNFRSISPEKTIGRLRKVCDEVITRDAEEALLAVARHRNKIVHFYHPDLADEREAIAVEQCL
jgi:hypothetical protein